MSVLRTVLISFVAWLLKSAYAMRKESHQKGLLEKNLSNLVSYT